MTALCLQIEKNLNKVLNHCTFLDKYPFNNFPHSYAIKQLGCVSVFNLRFIVQLVSGSSLEDPFYIATYYLRTMTHSLHIINTQLKLVSVLIRSGNMFRKICINLHWIALSILLLLVIPIAIMNNLHTIDGGQLGHDIIMVSLNIFFTWLLFRNKDARYEDARK